MILPVEEAGSGHQGPPGRATHMPERSSIVSCIALESSPDCLREASRSAGHKWQAQKAAAEVSESVKRASVRDAEAGSAVASCVSSALEIAHDMAKGVDRVWTK